MAAPKEQPPRKLSGKWTVGGGHSGKQAAASRRRLTEGVNGVVAGGVVMLSGPMTERGSASGRSDDGATDSVGGMAFAQWCRRISEAQPAPRSAQGTRRPAGAVRRPCNLRDNTVLPTHNSQRA